MTNQTRTIIANLDDTTITLLIELARRHLKLVLEHGRTDVTIERRQSIKGEIERLRSDRD